MPDITEGNKTTSDARRWVAASVGLVIFPTVFVLCSILINRLFGPPTQDPITLEFRDPLLTSGAALAWAAAGYVSATIAGLCAGLIAPDFSIKVFVYNSSALLIIMAFFVAAASGFTIRAVLVAITMLVGGFVGLRPYFSKS